jgi:hypothetical protein
VLTVVTGWLVTALTAFTISCGFALLIHYLHVWGVLLLLALVPVVMLVNHARHRARVTSANAEEVFNLKKVADPHETLFTTFSHMARLLREIRTSLDAALEALFVEDQDALLVQRRATKRIQRWTNIITANIFKALRLIARGRGDEYAQAARRLQKLADGHRDIVMRACMHVLNHHSGLLPVQVEELREIKQIVLDLLEEVETDFRQGRLTSVESVAAKDRALKAMAKRLNQNQIARIQDRSSKTRLTILFYAIVGNLALLSKQSTRLLGAFEEAFGETVAEYEFDLN